VSDESWIPLRFRDLDAFGHVYHAEYLTVLDEARARWFASIGVTDPSSYVVAHLEVDYLSPLVASDLAVRAVFEVERVGTTSVTVAEVLHARDGRVVARSRTVAVLRDPATGAKRALTARERAALGD
jgi:acyl-CoA thioester hydrolase